MSQARHTTPATLPLAGKRVLVTRTTGQAGDLSRRLRELGAEATEMPVIKIVPVSSSELLDRAIDGLDRFDWIVFTSANAVDAFHSRLSERGLDTGHLGDAKVAAIGTATTRRLRDLSIDPELVPEEAVAESLLDALKARGVAGSSILLPRAEVARDTLPDGLREAGADVHVVSVYRTVPADPDPAALRRLRDGEIDIVTFTSSSTVRNLLRMLDGDTALLNAGLVACIGPVTAATAREHGLRVDVVATDHSIPGLIAAIRQHVEGRAP
jgi:uroporphyrinogen-III synthase